MNGDKEVGNIYILSNPAMPDFVKIGYTMRSAIERAFELSNTSVPLPYKVECEILVERPLHIERILHTKLSKFRVAPDREFFRISALQAEEELNLLLFGERCPIATYPKKIANILELKEKYPTYFNDSSISETTKFLIFKSMEDLDPSFRYEIQKGSVSYEEFMGKFEDRSMPLTYSEASDKYLNPVKWWK